MKRHEIEKLFEKFYAGKTNLKEENELRDFLNQENIPEEYQAEKEYFELLEAEAHIELDETFDDKILQFVESKKESSNAIQMWTYRLSGVAAAILVFLLVWFGTDLLQPKEVYGTISDPSLAFYEAQKAMDKVSKKMNKGLQPAEKTVKKIDVNVKRVGDLKKMNQALENTKNLRKIDQASDLLKSVSRVYVSYGDS